MAVVYHWKHGWIPLDHTAALSKAKGNHALADKMLSDAHGSHGIQSRQDVAKAVRDLPNVPDSHRHEAVANVRIAAATHNALDLVPGSSHRATSDIRTRDDVREAFHRGDKVQYLPAGARDNSTARVYVNGKDVGQASTLLPNDAKHSGSRFGMADVSFPERTPKAPAPRQTKTQAELDAARNSHLAKMSDAELLNYLKHATGSTKASLEAELRRRGLAA